MFLWWLTVHSSNDRVGKQRAASGQSVSVGSERIELKQCYGIRFWTGVSVGPARNRTANSTR